MVFELDAVQTLLGAIAVLFLGAFVVSRVPVLDRYNIPEPVVGGLIFSVALAVINVSEHIEVSLETALREELMLGFFATVGLGANLRLLMAGGPKVAIFLAVAAGLLVLQNSVGVSLALFFDLDPHIGLLAGSITLSGGHGTGATYADLFNDTGELVGGMELALASATFGLILGGIIGGPVSQLLIARHKLEWPAREVKDDFGEKAPVPLEKEERVTVQSVLETLAMIAFCIAVGQEVYFFLKGHGITLPSFVTAIFVGIGLTNFLDLTRLYKPKEATLELLGTISLSLFLAMALMELKIWELVSLAGPLAVILICQTVLMGCYAYFITFRIMGANYSAAVMAGGHCGFGLGGTPTAVANMGAVTQRYGPSPEAFFVVPLVGAFFLDIVNALVIQGFLSLPIY